jgi:hypothetical protein
VGLGTEPSGDIHFDQLLEKVRHQFRSRLKKSPCFH